VLYQNLTLKQVNFTIQLYLKSLRKEIKLNNCNYILCTQILK
jgi:hypothetical protein